MTTPAIGTSSLDSEPLRRWLTEVTPGAAFAALLELLPGVVAFAVDGERRILTWSRGAEELLGFRAAEVLGEHCLKANRCANCMQGCGIERLGEVRDVPLTLFRPDGGEVRLRKTARAFFHPDGSFAGGVEVLVPDHERVAAAPRQVPREVEDFHGLLTRDPGTRELIQLIRNVARSQSPVLVQGESGTGKELVARGLHLESRRARAPFLALNCAALSPSLLESELFGHRKGAFTGALADKPGLFQQADGGTLFLDEVAELPLELQPKLLRVLQDQTFIPVGGVRAKRVDVRVISATHRALPAEVAAGRFREDLMYRLRVVPVYLAPLRDRRGDIEMLLWRFVEDRNPEAREPISGFTPDAMKALLDHPWPGNVRELQNVVDYLFAVGKGGDVGRADLPPELRAPRPPGSGLVDTGPGPATGRFRARWTPEQERRELLSALEAEDGHVGRAAARLGMSRPTFWRRRRKHGL